MSQRPRQRWQCQAFGHQQTRDFSTSRGRSWPSVSPSPGASYVSTSARSPCPCLAHATRESTFFAESLVKSVPTGGRTQLRLSCQRAVFHMVAIGREPAEEGRRRGPLVSGAWTALGLRRLQLEMGAGMFPAFVRLRGSAPVCGVEAAEARPTTRFVP